jgi:hypothetical protein
MAFDLHPTIGLVPSHHDIGCVPSAAWRTLIRCCSTLVRHLVGSTRVLHAACRNLFLVSNSLPTTICRNASSLTTDALLLQPLLDDRDDTAFSMILIARMLKEAAQAARSAPAMNRGSERGDPFEALEMLPCGSGWRMDD